MSLAVGTVAAKGCRWLQWTHYKGALKEARKNRDSALADADKARADADKLRAALQARPRAPS